MWRGPAFPGEGRDEQAGADNDSLLTLSWGENEAIKSDYEGVSEVIMPSCHLSLGNLNFQRQTY